MPKSKTRGSRKEHNKKVKHRNNVVKGNIRKMKEEYDKLFEQQMETLKAQYEGMKGKVDVETEVIDPLIQDIEVNDVEEVLSKNNDEN